MKNIQAILGYDNYEIDMSDTQDIKVYSLNYRNTGKRVQLTPGKSDGKHQQFILSSNNVKKKYSLHQLVWRQYNGEIPYGYDIHHIDENPCNNEMNNLQLLTRAEHMKIHSEKQNKAGKFGFKSRPVLQFDLDMKLIKEWPSRKEAQRQYGPCVVNCLYGRNRCKSAYGFKWKFKDEYIKSKDYSLK
jgi:hypothetical protein